MSLNLLTSTNLKNLGETFLSNGKYQISFSLFNDQSDAEDIYTVNNIGQLFYNGFVSSENYLVEVQEAFWRIFTGSAATSYSVMWQDVANIIFVDTDLNGNHSYDAGESVGVISVGQVGGPPFSSPQTAAGTISRDLDSNYTNAQHGDIWVNTTSVSNNFTSFGSGINIWNESTFNPGDYAYYAILHEIGHSLGLDHPDGDPELSSQNYTIMSYVAAVGMGASDIAEHVAPTGLQLLDIEAIQSIYGRNYDTRSTGTIYDKDGAFSSSKPNDAFIYTIWDGGGTDTIDASDYTIKATIDLRQGGFSSIGYNVLGNEATNAAINNVAIAYYAVIENAIGTDHHDILIGNAWNNRLEGGDGNDKLYGDGYEYNQTSGGLYWDGKGANRNYAKDLSGDDALYGGDGEDQLFGGQGKDALYGGADADTYFINIADTGIDYIFDTAEGGTLGNHIVLKNLQNYDVKFSYAGSNLIIWHMEAGVAEIDVIVHNQLTGNGVINTFEEVDDYIGAGGGSAATLIESVAASDLPIRTIHFATDHAAAFSAAEIAPDPLALDLNGDGTIGLNLTRSVHFDLDNDGFAEATDWVSGEDGILFRDINANGKADNITELFGGVYQNGFTDLRNLHDGNHDGKIDSADTIWNELKIWQDVNQDGQTQANEILSLSYFNITGINVSQTTSTGQSTLITTNGFAYTDDPDHTIGVSNLVLGTDKANTRFLGDYILDDDVLSLPDIRGYGRLKDLSIAASEIDSLDSNGKTIKEKLHEISDMSLFELLDNQEAVSDMIKTILYQWAEVEGVDPQSRGTNTDARKMIFVEKYLDEAYSDSFSSSMPNWAGGQAVVRIFENIHVEIMGQILFQTAANELFENSDIYDSVQGSVSSQKYILSEDTLEKLSDHASGLATTFDKIVFWEKVAGLLYYTNATFRLQNGGNYLDEEFNFLQSEQLKINAAISASDPTLVWFNPIGGQISISAYYFNPYTPNSITYRGTPGDDVAVGTSGNDTLFGENGNDTLTGYGGNDQIFGGIGNDVIYGGDGNDSIQGNDDDDELFGDSGNDRMWGGSGNDEIYGGTGGDTIVGGTGNNILFGGDGNDIIYSGDIINDNQPTSINTLVGGLGFDLLYGTSGNDIFIDGEGNDQNLFSGGGGNDIFRVIGSSEIFIDNTSTNIQYGTIELPSVYESEADLIIEIQGQDLVITGSIPGYEILIRVVDQFPNFSVVQTISFSNGYNFDLFTLMGSTHTQYGTTGNDTIDSLVTLPTTYGYPNVLVDYIYGADGRDKLYGFGGDDHLFGEEGADFLYGGTGNDSLYGGTENDSVYGGDGDDLIEGGDGGDYLKGEAGADTIYGGNGYDNIYGGDGEDYLSGGDDIDTLYGGAGSNIIDGGAKNDKLISDRGVSTGYIGSVSGYDTMHGGQGNDTYSIYTNVISRQDVIEDNGVAADYDGILFIGSVSTTKFRLVEGISTDLVLDLGAIGTITLKNQFSQDYMDRVEYYTINNGILTLLHNRTFVFEGTEAADNLYMPQYSVLANSSIFGYGGNDNIYGSANHDILNGGTGDDHLYGDLGNDNLIGGEGDDTLHGAVGSDIISGGMGDDIYVYNLSDGYDQIFEDVNSGTDTLLLGSGILPENVRMWIDSARYLRIDFVNSPYDRIITRGADSGGAYAANLENIIFANGITWDLTQGLTLVHNDDGGQIYGTNQDDTIDGRGGHDIIQGWGGNDTIIGGLGINTLRGGVGDDSYFIISGSMNTIEEDFVSSDIDTIYLSEDIALETIRSWIDNTGKMHIATEDGQERVAFSGTLSSSGVDLESYIENIYFSNGARWDLSQGLNLIDTDEDHYNYGSAFDDVIDARAGNDTISTYAGNDFVYGGAGQDIIYLGDGDDIAWANIDSNQHSHDSDGFIDGGAGNDEIHGYGEIHGGDGDDVIYGGGMVYGGAGNDIIHIADGYYYFENMFSSGGSGDDLIYGSLRRDNYIYNVGDGSDVIQDRGQDDTIYFGSGITVEDTILTRVGDNLEITFLGNTEDRITIINHYFIELLEDGNVYDGMLETLVFETTGHYNLYSLANLTNPQAQDDIFVMNQGAVLSGNLYADNGNGADFDADGDTLYLKDMSDLSPRRAESQLLTLGSGATVLILANGDFVYTPDVFFTGVDTFEYQILDSRLHFSSATVTINVEPANVAPYAKDDVLDVAYSGIIQGNVLLDNGDGADFDIYQDSLSIIENSITSASGAVVSMSSNGDFVYTSIEGFWGSDTFTYTITDGVFTDTATVTLNIGNPSLMIGTNNDDILIGTSLSNEIHGNDGNDYMDGGSGDDTIYGGDGADDIRGGAGDDYIDGGPTSDRYFYKAGDGIDTIIPSRNDSLEFEDIAPEDVILTRVGNNLEISFTNSSSDKIFVLDHYLLGTEGFDTRIRRINFTDGNYIDLRNQDPVAFNDNFIIQPNTVLYGNIFSDNGNGQDYDPEGDAFYIQEPYVGEINTTESGGSYIIYANGDFVYTPSTSFVGEDSFYYNISDGDENDGGNVTITVGNINSAPDAKNDSFSVNHGQYGSNVTGNLLSDNGNGADTDSDGGTLSIVETSIISAQGIAVSVSANGNFTYYSSVGYIGTDTFSYTLSDGQGGTDTAMATVTISAPSGYTLGTSSSDTFNGTSSADKYFGMDGDDILTGNSGHDELYGSTGNDTIYGGAGMDVIFGGTGTNYLYGGADNDSLFSENSTDVLEGGTGSDTYRFKMPWTFNGMTIEDNGSNTDTSDALYFYSLTSQLVPTYRLLSGNTLDLIVNLAGYGDLTIKNQFAQDGTDRIESIKYSTGFSGVNPYRDDAITVMPMTFEGSSGDDILTLPSYGLSVPTLPAAAHTIKGLDGSDTITGSNGADKLYGGNGNDTLTASLGNDELYGEDGDDTMYGGGGTDVLYGGAGTNHLYGGSENDNLYSVSSSDTLEGGTGSDSYRFTLPSSLAGTIIEDNGLNTDTADGVYLYNLITQIAPTYRLLSGNALDLVVNIAGYGEFTIKNQFAQDGTDRIESIKYSMGFSGVNPYRDDAITVMPMTFEGSSGDDVLTLPSYGLSIPTQLTAAHILNGLDGNDTITGANGADKLYGGNGNDTLSGGSGTDQLNGDAGSDTLIGGIGNDILYGGADDDIFWLTTMSGTDNIMDFSLSQNDKIDLADLLQGYNPLTHAITDFVQITTSGSNSLLKVDVDGGANNFVQVATINGVTGLTDEAALVASGNLVAT